MLLKDIKAVARENGVKPGKLKKLDLIREIQKAEGNDPCFKSEILSTCSETECLWYSDCQ